MDFDSLTEAAWLSHITELARAYKRIFGRTLALTDELGELHPCNLMELSRAIAGMAGYDATDKEGRHVQIKARAPRVGSQVNRVGRVGRFVSWDFDYALLVLLDSDCQLEAILRAERQDVQELQEKVNNPKVGVTVSAFLRISHPVYRAREDVWRVRRPRTQINRLPNEVGP